MTSINTKNIQTTRRLEMHLETEADFDSIKAFISQTYPQEYIPHPEALLEEHTFYYLLRKGMLGGKFGRWLVKEKNTDAVIGIGMLIPHLCTAEESTVLDGTPNTGTCIEAEVGWVVAQHARKQGFGMEIGNFLCHYALETTRLRRVLGITEVNNTSSIRLLEKLGMQISILSDTSSVFGVLSRQQFQNITT